MCYLIDFCDVELNLTCLTTSNYTVCPVSRFRCPGAQKVVKISLKYSLVNMHFDLERIWKKAPQGAFSEPKVSGMQTRIFPGSTMLNFWWEQLPAEFDQVLKKSNGWTNRLEVAILLDFYPFYPLESQEEFYWKNHYANVHIEIQLTAKYFKKLWLVTQE